MNYALVRKTARDSLLIFLIVVLGILVFETFFTRAVREFGTDMGGRMLQLPIMRRFIRTLVGADFDGEISVTGLMTLGFVHPVVLALTWGMLITHCTRVLAGEFDRGTADLVLSLPVSRTAHYNSVSLVWLLMGIPISLAPLCGIAIATNIITLSQPVDLSRLSIITLNFAALYIAVGGVATGISALNNNRAPAVAIIVGGLLASMFINFLVPFFENQMLEIGPADPTPHPFIHTIKYLGVLQYYQPLPILRSGKIPWSNIFILVSIGAAVWLIGLFRYSRRDIPAA